MCKSNTDNHLMKGSDWGPLVTTKQALPTVSCSDYRRMGKLKEESALSHGAGPRLYIAQLTAWANRGTVQLQPLIPNTCLLGVSLE